MSKFMNNIVPRKKNERERERERERDKNTLIERISLLLQKMNVGWLNDYTDKQI